VRYFRWDPYSGTDEDESESVWSLSIQLKNFQEWDLRLGKYIEGWDTNTTAVYDEEIEHTDFPFATGLLPVYSTRLKSLMENLGLVSI
jgi:hypothetical protein